MAIRLNQSSHEFAKKLILSGKCVLDEQTDWTDHRPSRRQQKRVIFEVGIAAFSRWHLAEDDEIEEGAQSRYKFPYGDFSRVHRCAVLTAESATQRFELTEIARVCAQLRTMLDELMARERLERRHVHQF